ncbi:hypothetical protein B0I37DRAFT_123167 [Chaetomium sp. MPI-CAGE-AT-0009]|nr:hypothetical protein B0I37DRAFT_123167 [Chaetomium sp. MPI-CAGE-AT-0009]
MRNGQAAWLGESYLFPLVASVFARVPASDSSLTVNKPHLLQSTYASRDRATLPTPEDPPQPSMNDCTSSSSTDQPFSSSNSDQTTYLQPPSTFPH